MVPVFWSTTLNRIGRLPGFVIRDNEPLSSIYVEDTHTIFIHRHLFLQLLLNIHCCNMAIPCFNIILIIKGVLEAPPHYTSPHYFVFVFGALNLPLERFIVGKIPLMGWKLHQISSVHNEVTLILSLIIPPFYAKCALLK